MGHHQGVGILQPLRALQGQVVLHSIGSASLEGHGGHPQRPNCQHYWDAIIAVV